MLDPHRIRTEFPGLDTDMVFMDNAGGSQILGRVVDPARPLEVLATERVDTPLGGDNIVAAIAALVDRLASAAGGAPLSAVGVGAPMVKSAALSSLSTKVALRAAAVVFESVRVAVPS